MVQPCIWFKEEPSQFSMGQTAQCLTWRSGKTTYRVGRMYENPTLVLKSKELCSEDGQEVLPMPLSALACSFRPLPTPCPPATCASGQTATRPPCPGSGPDRHPPCSDSTMGDDTTLIIYYKGHCYSLLCGRHIWKPL